MRDILASELSIGDVIEWPRSGPHRRVAEVWEESRGRVLAITITDTDKFGDVEEWRDIDTITVL